ncbi:MAG: signal peptidase I [bacterium]|nr:signal peptidase I [bacterium]
MKKIATISFFAIIIIVLILVVVSKIDNSPLMILKVLSGSMEPTINTNELVLVIKQDQYKENDIVTYKIDNYFITHRIKEMTNDQVITKGDNNDDVDKAIELSDIKGKVVLIIPAFYSNVFTVIGIVALIILLIIILA